MVKTIGLKEIPIEQLTRKSVISGKRKFPTSPREKQLQRFLSKKYRLPGSEKPLGYHSSPENLKSLMIEPGSSELPGLYISSEVSPYFLKISKQTKLYGGGVFSGQPDPSISAITPDRFVVNPAYKIKGKYFWSQPTREGTAYIPKIKTEIEAILKPGTYLKTTNKRFFTRWRGVRIPITEYKTANWGGLKVVEQGVISSNLGSSYSLTTFPSSYLLSSETLGLASYKSYKPSTISSNLAYSPVDYSLISRPSSLKTTTDYKLFSVPSSNIKSPISINKGFSSAGAYSVSYANVPSSGYSGGRFTPTKLKTTTTPLPKIDLPYLEKKQKKKKPTERKFKYQPSLVARASKIKDKIPKIKTGIGIRPIQI